MWPLSWGGPNEEGNEVVLCPTGHRNIHILLNRYRVHNGKPPWGVLQSYGPGERALAAAGWAKEMESKEEE